MKTKPSIHDSPTMPKLGFTLVELLVVIMIISMMAVLTLIITGKLKDKAYQTGALNTMRQVATANATYSMDNNGDINVHLGAGDTRCVDNHARSSFWGRLVPYLFSDIDTTENDDTELKAALKLRLDALFSTPDSTTMAKTFQKAADIKLDGSNLPMPFAFNTNVNMPNEYVKSHSFHDPGQIVYMSYGFGFFGELDADTYEPMRKPRSNIIDWFPNKTGLFTFLDGHVEILSPPIPERRFQDPAATP